MIPFLNISKNPLEHYTFLKKFNGFCIPVHEAPQPECKIQEKGDLLLICHIYFTSHHI